MGMRTVLGLTSDKDEDSMTVNYVKIFLVES